MARAVSSFGGLETSGMVGGQSYRPSRSGQIVQMRPHGSQKVTPRQALARSVMADAVRAWSNLSDADRDAWQSVAPSGSTGYNAYMSAFLFSASNYKLKGNTDYDPAFIAEFLYPWPAPGDKLHAEEYRVMWLEPFGFVFDTVFLFGSVIWQYYAAPLRGPSDMSRDRKKARPFTSSFADSTNFQPLPVPDWPYWYIWVECRSAGSCIWMFDKQFRVINTEITEI